MANTYSQITIQLIFAVKSRDAMILPAFKERLYKYITGIVTNQKQKMLAINGTHNHIHMLLGISPDIRISDLVRDIKSDSSLFINENKLSRFRFYWQEGFGAFSYSKEQRDSVIKYIMNQEEHHRKRTFREEYIELLKQFDVEYDVKYLFDFFDN